MKNLKALFGLAVLFAAVYVAWAVLPPYYNNFQFQDAVDAEAKMSSYSTKTEFEMQESLAKKAQEFDIPLKAEQIHVVRSGNELSIWAEYQIHVDLPLYPVDLRFQPATKNKKI
ncbi:MAG TPA: hypothetical protein VN622_02020 [Clostridia bacterium]|nr:hypothetical protein [Clostridia bacterium]